MIQIFALLMALFSTPAAAQCTGVFPSNTFCGNSTGAAAPPKPSTLPASSGAVFNVRTYGAIPDGSTDNSTAIAATFTASNGYTNGVPTVFFDCGSSATTCVYNYGGSGTSPINPTIATTILCAPGVILNYTGTAHAADIGSGLQNVKSGDPMTIQGCRWQGGASFTQGLYLKNFLTNIHIFGNVFRNFGPSSPSNTTGAAIFYFGNNFESIITNNFFTDTDGVPRNGINAVSNAYLIFSNNVFDCYNAAPGTACQVSPAGYGIWTCSVNLSDSLMQFHYPNLRISSNADCTYETRVTNTHFEGNTSSPSPMITYGDPGGAAFNFPANSLNLDNDFFFWTSANANIPFIGPETPVSGSYSLNKSYFENLFFASSPGSGATYIKVNGGSFNLMSNIAVGAGLVTPTTFFDNYFPQYITPQARVGSAGGLAGQMAVFDSSAQVLNVAGLNNIATPLICQNITASNVQSCSTNPSADVTGTAFTLTTGGVILYESSFTNTGDVTIAVNTQAATHIRKNNATQTLNAGDITAGTWYLLTYDGTYWEMQGQPTTSTLGPLTFAQLPGSPATGTMTYMSDGLAGNCADSSCTTWGTNVTGGTGALKLLIWWNGAHWTLAGK